MSFVRPEATAAITRWREALIGAAAVAIGAWWFLGPGGLLGWIGLAVMLGGVALIVLGIQRGRFRIPGNGPGVVQVDEGRITYFGPLTGGVVDLAELSRLEIDATGTPAHWRLTQPGQPPLYIPVTADGAEALFDAFATLPGLRTGQLGAQINTRATHPVVIWHKPQNRLH
jgi:hypothetical protein